MAKTFEETIEKLISRHATNVGGTEIWVDWDEIYSDLLDEGYSSHMASAKLDDYIESNGY